MGICKFLFFVIKISDEWLSTVNDFMIFECIELFLLVHSVPNLEIGIIDSNDLRIGVYFEEDMIEILNLVWELATLY